MWGGFAWGAGAWASQPEYVVSGGQGGVVVGGDKTAMRAVGGDMAAGEGIVVGGDRSTASVVGGDVRA